MADPILPAESSVRGVRRKFSKKFNREVWGYDVRVGEQRFRRYCFDTREEAESAIRQYILERHKRAAQLVTGESEIASPPLPSVDKHCKLGSIGACAEMVVCVDLLRRGYDVFRSVSPNAECDLIVALRGKLCRVEVKSATAKRGRVTYYHARMHKSKFDMLALVYLRENRVYYHPSPAEFFADTAVKDPIQDS